MRARAAVFRGVEAVAAAAAIQRPLGRMQHHAHALATAVGKRQHAQPGRAIQCQAEVARTVDQVGADAAPARSAIERILPGARLGIEVFDDHALWRMQVRAVRADQRGHAAAAQAGGAGAALGRLGTRGQGMRGRLGLGMDRQDGGRHEPLHSCGVGDQWRKV